MTPVQVSKRVPPKYTRIALLGVAITMGSCTNSLSSQTPVVFHLDAPDYASFAALADHRSPEEKSLRSPSFGKPGFRLGDENFSPDRLKVMALRFQSKLGSSYEDKTIKVEYFEVTVFKPPSPSRPGVPYIGGGFPGLIGTLFAESLIALTEEKRETLIVVCEIRGSVAGRSFKGSSDRVIPDPKADLAKAVSDVVREAIDDSADGLIKAFP